MVSDQYIYTLTACRWIPISTWTRRRVSLSAADTVARRSPLKCTNDRWHDEWSLVKRRSTCFILDRSTFVERENVLLRPRRRRDSQVHLVVFVSRLIYHGNLRRYIEYFSILTNDVAISSARLPHTINFHPFRLMRNKRGYENGLFLCFPSSTGPVHFLSFHHLFDVSN